MKGIEDLSFSHFLLFLKPLPASACGPLPSILYRMHPSLIFTLSRISLVCGAQFLQSSVNILILYRIEIKHSSYLSEKGLPNIV
jgi:hypothetical protein